MASLLSIKACVCVYITFPNTITTYLHANISQLLFLLHTLTSNLDQFCLPVLRVHFCILSTCLRSPFGLIYTCLTVSKMAVAQINPFDIHGQVYCRQTDTHIRLEVIQLVDTAAFTDQHTSD